MEILDRNACMKPEPASNSLNRYNQVSPGQEINQKKKKKKNQLLRKVIGYSCLLTINFKKVMKVIRLLKRDCQFFTLDASHPRKREMAVVWRSLNPIRQKFLWAVYRCFHSEMV